MKGYEWEGEITWQDRKTRSRGRESVMTFHWALLGTGLSIVCQAWETKLPTKEPIDGTLKPQRLKIIPILLSRYTIPTWHCKDKKKPRSVNLKISQGTRRDASTWHVDLLEKQSQKPWQQIKRGRDLRDLGLVQDFSAISRKAGFNAQQTHRQNWPKSLMLSFS